MLGWLSAALLGAITVADLLTPSGLVVGTLLSVPVALAALAGRQRLTGALTVLAVGANVGAGVLGAMRDGVGPDLGNRAISVGAVLLVEIGRAHV